MPLGIPSRNGNNINSNNINIVNNNNIKINSDLYV